MLLITFRRIPLFMLAVLMLLAFGLAACVGGDSDSRTPAPAKSSIPTPTAEATVTPTPDPTPTPTPEPTPPPSPTPKPTPVTTPTVVPPMQTQAPTEAPNPSVGIPITVTSVTPDPAANGVEVTIVLATAPGAVVAIRITDPGAGIANQRTLTADGQGAVIHRYVVAGDPGTWMVQVAAAATIADLLVLQQNLVPGPYYDAATFTVQ